MATYGYKAITKAGKEVKGSLEADNKDLAMAELRRQELTVIDLGEQSFLTKDIDIQIGGWPKARDLSVMCRQFVSMTKAGVSILESLKMLCEQTENKRLQDALKEVRISVEKGETLADSMAEHPKVFPAIMVNMVAAGEASGSLDTAMDRVATQLEKSHKTQAMVKKAMIYPIAVCVVAVIVTVVMLVKVIPSYEDMFTQIGGELPWITKFYVNLSHGIINYWFIIVPVIVAFVFAIRTFAKTDVGKHFFGKIALKIPLFNKLTIKSASSMMARTLSTLMGAGVPLIEAMVKKAMIYPIAVCVVAVIVTVVMLVKVIPSYEDMFTQIGGELPWITKFYVNLSHGIINYWFIIVPVIVAFVFAIRTFAKTDVGKHFFGKIALKIPLFNKLTIKSASSMMARTLSTLMGAGVPLIEAVDIVSGVMENVYFKEALQDAKEEITIGMPLSRPLQESGLFPPMVYQMIRIGEESGNTEEMLDKLADYYEEEVEMAVQSLMAAMEPMIIIVLAVVVGGLIAACMMPMMSMYEALDAM